MTHVLDEIALGYRYRDHFRYADPSFIEIGTNPSARLMVVVLILAPSPCDRIGWGCFTWRTSTMWVQIYLSSADRKIGIVSRCLLKSFQPMYWSFRSCPSRDNKKHRYCFFPNSAFESSLMSFSSVSSKPLDLEDEDDPPHATQDQFDDATDKSDEANEEPLDPRIQVRPSMIRMILSFVIHGCLDWIGTCQCCN